MGRVALYGRTLSPREREVVQWLTAGLSRADIATRMGITEETVKTYLAAIYAKLGATNRFEVAARHVSSSPATPVSGAGTAPERGSPSAPTDPAAPNETNGPNETTPPTRRE
jgi:DNA-binding CsgD family transcriptional regulator